MADGYGWLLNHCGDNEMIEHAAHLDDDRAAPGCTYCPITHDSYPESDNHFGGHCWCGSIHPESHVEGNDHG